MNLHEQIFLKDQTLWSKDLAVQKLIANRLGWLDAPQFSREKLPLLTTIRQRVLDAGFNQVVLLGMGGSSLAPEVFNELLPNSITQELSLIVLDGTCPGQIATVESQVELSKTLFIVASKSGGTVETRYLFDYFYNAVSDSYSAFSIEEVGTHFIAITDSGSVLAHIADERKFFECFINPTDIGGRYSALSYFGLVPAALLGWDIEKLLDRADAAISANKEGNGWGVKLGEWLSQDYHKPIDILLFSINSSKLNALFMWIEQLVAESLGKQGEGILLVNIGSEDYSLSSNAKLIEIIFDAEKLSDFSQQNSARICLKDEYDMAEQFFHWEFATAIAAAKIGINPFDEPNVSEAKQKTSELLMQSGHVQIPGSELAIKRFLQELKGSEYLGLLVYAEANEENFAEVQRIKEDIEKYIDIPITINYGPRYLHSVGQLHKGGKQHGAFLVFVETPKVTLLIPTQDFGFDKLFRAQALGDFEILRGKGLPAEIYTVDNLEEVKI
jgi:transaldolase/glucose-6-phosphate isomerase